MGRVAQAREVGRGLLGRQLGQLRSRIHTTPQPEKQNQGGSQGTRPWRREARANSHGTSVLAQRARPRLPYTRVEVEAQIESAAARRGQPRQLVPHGALVLALLALALLLRLWGLGAESLWFDEIESVRLSDGPIADVLKDPADSVHPPLYFLILHAWRSLAGDTDASLRWPSLLASLAGLGALYLLARDLAGREAALIAILLGAVNPLDVYYAQEARMYAQATLLATLAAWCLWRWLEGRDRGDSRRHRLGWIAGYTLCAAALLYTHYLGAILLLAQGGFALLAFSWQRRGRDLGAYLTCAAATAVLFVPWLLYVLGLRDTLYSDRQMEWMARPTLGDGVLLPGRELLRGLAPEGGLGTLVVGLGLAAVVVGTCLLWAWSLRADRPKAPVRPSFLGLAYALWLLAMPVALAIAFSLAYRPVFLANRFALFVLPPFLVLAGTAAIRTSAGRAVLTTALTGLMLVATVHQRLTAQKPDWRALAAEWPQRQAPSLVVCYPKDLMYCVNHYLERPIPPSNRTTVEALLPRLAGAELWIVSSDNYPFQALPGDARDYAWLLGQGKRLEARSVAADYRVEVLLVGRHPLTLETVLGTFNSLPPVDRPGLLDGFADPTGFYPLELEGQREPWRWSRPQALLRFEPGAVVAALSIAVERPPSPGDGRVQVWAHRGQLPPGNDLAELFAAPPLLDLEQPAGAPFHLEIPAPPGAGPLWVTWRAPPVTLPGRGPKWLGIGVENPLYEQRVVGLKVQGVSWSLRDPHLTPSPG